MMRRWIFRAFLIGVLLIAAFVAWIASARFELRDFETSDVVRDRNGELLTVYTTSDGFWRLPCRVEQVDERFIEMLIAYEDKRFYQHNGVDARALVRAMRDVILGDARAGASTISMQTVRLLEDLPTGSYLAKLKQIRLAFAMERALSKSEILNLYLENAPFGGNIEGVCSASYAYFSKEPKQLSLAEAALLIALPQSPTARQPNRYPENARIARARILDALARVGKLTSDQVRVSKSDVLPNTLSGFPRLALHISDQYRSVRANLTIDRKLQSNLESYFRRAIALEATSLSGAIIVLNYRTGEVVSYIGSPDYQDVLRRGYIDMAQAPRSPGSTLKPLIYGVAFSNGLLHPQTLIRDTRQSFGTYDPNNFDGTFMGVMSVQKALQTSRNVPAVIALERVGVERFLSYFQRMEIDPKFPNKQPPGLAIALGGIGFNPIDMAQIYGMIANNGKFTQLIFELAPTHKTTETSILSSISAQMLKEILRQTRAPNGRPSGQIAFKTGTSYGYRDAWSIGFDNQYVVAVQLGRADNQSVAGLSGFQSAAPILFGAFDIIGISSLERATIETLPMERPPDHLRTLDNTSADKTNFSVRFPADNTEIELCDAKLVVKLENGKPPYTIILNDVLIFVDIYEDQAVYSTLPKGFHSLLTIDANGKMARSAFRVLACE